MTVFVRWLNKDVVQQVNYPSTPPYWHKTRAHVMEIVELLPENSVDSARVGLLMT